MFIPIVLFFGSLAAALVLQQGGYLVMENMLEIGVLSAFVSYALGILEPVQQMARVFAEVIAAQVNIERVTTLLDVYKRQLLHAAHDEVHNQHHQGNGQHPCQQKLDQRRAFLRDNLGRCV